jgi:hypothetical protein
MWCTQENGRDVGSGFAEGTPTATCLIPITDTFRSKICRDEGQSCQFCYAREEFSVAFRLVVSVHKLDSRIVIN